MKKATSYIKLKALLGGLFGAIQSAVTDSQSDFDAYMRFVRRNGNIFTVAKVGFLDLTLDYEASNDVYALGILEGSNYIADGFCFSSGEDISDDAAAAVKAAWEKAIEERKSAESF